MSAPVTLLTSLESCVHVESEYVLEFAVATLVKEKMIKICDYYKKCHAEIGLN